jgi:membrane-bound ClpP family serine protease
MYSSWSITKGKVLWIFLVAIGVVLYWRTKSPNWDWLIVLLIAAVVLFLVYAVPEEAVWGVSVVVAVFAGSFLISVSVPPAQTPTATSLVAVTQQPTKTATSTQRITTIDAGVRASSLNVRAEPNGAVVGYLGGGESVTVSECDGSWCHIEQPFDGWVWRGCLTDNPDDLGCQAK